MAIIATTQLPGCGLCCVHGNSQSSGHSSQNPDHSTPVMGLQICKMLIDAPGFHPEVHKFKKLGFVNLRMQAWHTNQQTLNP